MNNIHKLHIKLHFGCVEEEKTIFRIMKDYNQKNEFWLNCSPERCFCVTEGECGKCL